MLSIQKSSFNSMDAFVVGKTEHLQHGFSDMFQIRD